MGIVALVLSYTGLPESFDAEPILARIVPCGHSRQGFDKRLILPLPLWFMPRPYVAFSYCRFD